MMCVVAHPDDECFAFGGALALASQRGVEIDCVCFTAGQAATNRGSAKSDEELAQLRKAEFAESCKALGVSRYEVLDYYDGKMEFASVSEAAALLVKRMRQFKPQVVLTFGLDGSVNVHPDHSMVSAIASMAFHWCGRPKRFPELGQPYLPQRLYHQTVNFTMPDRQPLLPAPWTVVLDTTSVLPLRIEAFLKHTTQVPVLDSVKPFFEKHGKEEVYVVMGSSEPQPSRMLTDMFEGVDPSQ